MLGGGAALYWLKLRKPKTDTRGSDDLDDYDYGEDEDTDEDYEFETEEERRYGGIGRMTQQIKTEEKLRNRHPARGWFSLCGANRRLLSNRCFHRT